MHKCPDFFSAFLKGNGMFKFKLKIMIIGIWAETDIFDDGLLGLALNLFLFFCCS